MDELIRSLPHAKRNAMMEIRARIGMIIMFYLGTFLLSCQSDLKFDSNKWKNAGGGDNITLNIRAKMVNDLIESEILLNKNEQEIAQLIGNSEKLHNKKTNSRYYPVQEKYGWNIDPTEMTFLEIIFDEQGMSETVKFISTK